MSSVLGVSVGAGAIRLARPAPGNSAERFAPDHFELQTLPVDDQRVEEVAADGLGAALSPEVAATAIAFRSEQHARALRAALARRQLTNYELVPEVVAALQFLESAGELSGFRTIALYDLGSSGLSVSVVDVASRQILYSERTSDISGDYLDSLIREQQIASGRIAHPPDPEGLAALDALCRQAKEQLSVNTAVALPSEHGLVLISQENFEALIMLAVESSARMARDVIMRSEQAVQAVVAIGGCAQIPLVTRVLGRWLGMPVVVPAHPETVVARGAALLARPARPVAAPQPGPSHTEDTEQLQPAWLSDDSAPRTRREAKVGRGLELARGRRREMSVAGVAVGALVVVAAVGLGLGWAPQVLQGNSQSSKTSPTTTETSTPHTTVAEPTATPAPTDTTMESVAAPPPRYQPTTEPPPPPPGPNTIVVPGLPPIVVPPIPPLPPLFPGPPQ
ncbi:Hsp70 family protein [Nocardia sp. CDC159]|uniref:Hsp70 family protein n=1 Tax=Nocardia pulmonis TaxID=2951408 RepID=A0A9X2ED68_9NOCA|nr:MULTISPECIES: Hsp70 family protein [Nocardia]MCM6777255.1 Hsp70 family protein [Nocardia pulmonis]MCM6790140.1 Hsp70 family protein [Nocardia sp. CDC159]